MQARESSNPREVPRWFSCGSSTGTIFSAPTGSLEFELSASIDLRILLHGFTLMLQHRDNRQAWGNEDPRMADSVSSRKTVFACFAHPDDEVGALGTLANHVDRGDRVVLAWMTSGENTSMSKAKTRPRWPENGVSMGRKWARSSAVR